jgi:hypothetical protein
MIRQYYNALLSGELSIHELSEDTKGLLMAYVSKEITILTRDIEELVKVNPEKDFEYWTLHYWNYRDAIYIHYLLKNPYRKLTKDELVLYYFYSGIPIGTKNQDKIAKAHGLKGHKLAQRYSEYANDYELRTSATTEITKEKAIERMKRVIEALPEERKGKALKELEDLKNYVSA